MLAGDRRCAPDLCGDHCAQPEGADGCGCVGNGLGLGVWSMLTHWAPCLPQTWSCSGDMHAEDSWSRWATRMACGLWRCCCGTNALAAIPSGTRFAPARNRACVRWLTCSPLQAVEAEWQHQHNASDGEMWRLRIKRSEAWQTMRKLYDEVEFQAAAAEVFSEYLAFCEDHGEELLRLYNQGDAKLEGVKSADESGASASSAATTTEGAPTDGAATDTDASDTDAEDSSSDEVTSEVDKKSAAATKVTSPARAVPAAAAAKKKRPASSTKLSSARVRWRMSGSSADSETSASDDDDVLQHATASRAQVRTFN